MTGYIVIPIVVVVWFIGYVIKDFYSDKRLSFGQAISLAHIQTPKLDLNNQTQYSLGSYKGSSIKMRYVYYGTELYLRIKIPHKISVIEKFSLKKETITSKSKKILGINDILTKDKPFDKNILLESEGNKNVINIIFNKNVRKLILSISKRSKYIKITEKYSMIDVLPHKFQNIKSFSKYMNNLIKIGQDITGETELKQRIINNINLDTSSEEKINNIRSLVNYFGTGDEINKIITRTLHDKNINVRIESAKYLKTSGLRFLFNLLLTESLSDENIITIASIFKDKKYKKGIHQLIEVYKSSTNKKVKTEILKAIQTITSVKIRKFLSAQLYSDNNEMKLAIIDTIGYCSTINEVEKLYLYGKESLNPKVKTAVKNSIRMIQSRLGLIDTGWLSINELEDKEGALSYSEGAEGALSLNIKKVKKKKR